MNLTYVACKVVIENKSYVSKEDMQLKLDIFLLNNRIDKEQYDELTTMLKNS